MSGHDPNDLVIERVLRAVEQVPSGRIVSYGIVADLVGTSARRVGAIMAVFGGEVAWWRVTTRDGRLPDQLLELARKHWEIEGVGFDGNGCYIDVHHADPAKLAADYVAATADLAG